MHILLFQRYRFCKLLRRKIPRPYHENRDLTLQTTSPFPIIPQVSRNSVPIDIVVLSLSVCALLADTDFAGPRQIGDNLFLQPCNTAFDIAAVIVEMRGNSQPAKSRVSTPDQNLLSLQLLANSFKVFSHEADITGALQVFGRCHEFESKRFHCLMNHATERQCVLFNSIDAGL